MKKKSVNPRREVAPACTNSVKNRNFCHRSFGYEEKQLSN